MDTQNLADGLVQLESNNYSRCTHKPTPFPYESAWIDQIGNFDIIRSSLVIDMINSKISGVYNVGTEMKSVYQLALKTKKY
jgi:hypothetical protein